MSDEINIAARGDQAADTTVNLSYFTWYSHSSAVVVACKTESI